jgi:1,4-alpha-glucan branching enzyme
MSVQKKYLKNGSVCKVTFRISGDHARNAHQAAVVGEFNGWDSTVSPMKKLKNGTFSLTMNFPAGGRYQFRYLLDDNTWISESQADGSVYCAFGNCENSLIDLCT